MKENAISGIAKQSQTQAVIIKHKILSRKTEVERKSFPSSNRIYRFV